jgi:two-component system NtrC family sensor kinase
LNQLIEAAILLVFTKRAGQKIALNKMLSPLPEMFLDGNQIKQVIVNLLNNAVQAMLDNKGYPATLTVMTSLERLSPALDDGNTNKPDTEQIVACKISDTGHGIKPEHLDKIFDPFFTTKEVGQGTGLGLSISYGIVEKHGGNISVESTPGKGSSFTLTLPTTEPPPTITASTDYTRAVTLL